MPITLFVCKFAHKESHNEFKCEVDEIVANDGMTYCKGDEMHKCKDVLFVNPETGEEVI